MKLSEAIKKWADKGIAKEDALVKAKEAVKKVGKRWTKGMQLIFDENFAKGLALTLLIKPSKLFYGFEIKENPEDLTPEKMGKLKKDFKYPKSKFCVLLSGDEVLLKSANTNKKLKGNILGFSFFGQKTRVICVLLPDGYAMFDLVTMGDQILKATRDGKVLPTTIRKK